MHKMIPAAKVVTSETNGRVRGNEAAGNIIGMSMKAGIREDGLAGVGEIQVGEAVNGRPTAKSGSRTTPRPWTGRVSSEMAEA